jgi:MFS family permease
VNLIELHSLTMFRKAANGLYSYEPLGRLGPAFQLKVEQRRNRALFSMVSVWVLLFLTGWVNETYESAAAFAWWFLIVCICLVLVLLLAAIGLQRMVKLPPRTPEERAEYHRWLREQRGILWVSAVPVFVCIWLGGGVAIGFPAEWWLNLFMVLAVFALLIAWFSRFRFRSRKTQPPV